MPRIVPKERAVVFFSQLPIPSLSPHRSLVRITGDAADAKKVERGLTLDMLKFFNPKPREYDYYFFYAPLRVGQKMNFVQLKDTYKLRLKKTIPQEQYEQPVSMAFALLKMLKLKYKEILIVQPMSVILDYRDVLSTFDLLQDHDVALWRQKDGALGSITVRNSETILNLLESILPCTSAKLFEEIKTHPSIVLKDISPPLSSIDHLFNYSPAQITQYYEELGHFSELISS